MVELAICTIVSKNYLAHARTLVESFHRHHPQGQAFVLLADQVDGFFDPSAEDFTLIEAKDLGIPDFEQMAFRYNVTEFNTAVKPFFLERLFERESISSLIYFDPDIYIYRRLEQLQTLLESCDIVLTPHVLDFLDDGRQPDDVYILRAGVHNLGFIGLKKGPGSSKLLTWWKARLFKDCVVDFPRGIFVDQRWIDLVPGVFAGTHVLRDPGHNVAYWNLNHRAVARAQDVWKVNGVPLTFFHFSGLPMDDVNAVSKYQDRVSLGERPELKPLFYAYRDRLLANGHATVKHWPYAYGRFDDGTPIADAVRYLWRNMRGDGRWPRPFDTQDPAGYFAWLKGDSGGGPHRQRIVNRMALDAWAQSWYLQELFPDPIGEHSAAFSEWFLQQPDTVRALALVPGASPADPQPAGSSQEHDRATLYRQGPPSLVARMYYGLRAPLRRLGLTRPLKTLLGPRRSGDLWRLAHERRATQPISAPAEPLSPRNAADWTGVNLVGYARAETGVGEVLRSIARSLQAVGWKVAVTDLTNPDWARSDDTSLSHLPAGNPYAVNLLVVNADMVPETRRQLGAGFFEDRHTIGFWHWETANFPAMWHDRFDGFQEIWVDSSFLQGALAAVSPVPVVNVRLAVETGGIVRQSREALGLPEDRTLFFFGFDAGSYIQRKNPFAVVEAFRRAFGPSYQHVGLIIKATNLQLAGAEADRLARDVESVGGRLIGEYMDRSTLNSLFASTDVYVSLHRSEGFGLTMAEAMALGKPVIATAYSGNMEFMTPANSFLTGYRVIPIDGDYGPYRRDDVWAEPDVEQAAAHMRAIVELPEHAGHVGARAAQDIAHEFNPVAVGKRMAARLQHLKSRSR